MKPGRTFGFAFVLSLAAAPLACGEDPKSPDPAGGTGGSGASGGSESGGRSGSGGRGGRGGSGNDAGMAGEDTGSGGRGASGGSANGGDDGSGGDGDSGGDGSGATGGAGGRGGSAGSGGTGGLPDPVAHCSDPWSELEPSAECDVYGLEESTTVTLEGDITADLTLASGSAYRLSGPTRVMNGATLTIEPCVRIVGQSPESILAILPGSKIEADGEAESPIVFTSKQAEGSRVPGDWGGLIILGNARHNLATDTTKPVIEGLVMAEEYGSHTDANDGESSGTLRHVRVEYVGRDLGAGNESNGITFGAVGSGTTLSHVMVSNSIDDCFEWFGGTVSADHLIAFNCDDDMFDADNGYSGHVQFAFGRQYPTTFETDSNGFELDTAASFAGVEPDTSARWSNVTICGTNSGQTSEAGNPGDRYGAVLRREVAGGIMNALVTGFDNGVVSVRDQSPITWTDSMFFDNELLYGELHGGGDQWLQDQQGNEFDPPYGFCDCWANPPNPFPMTRIEGAAPDDFADDAADFKGAFVDSSPENNWMAGAWTDWSEQ